MWLRRLPAFAISVQRRRIHWFYIKVIAAKSNILRNKSALVMGICITFTCFQTLRPRKRGFLHEIGFSPDFLFHIDRYHFDGPSSSESKEPRFRSLEIEANAVIYIHPKFSNELGFWCRQPSTTEISLLRNLVASQQQRFEYDICINNVSAGKCLSHSTR